MTKERHAKRRKVVSHCHYNFISAWRKEKALINNPLNEFTKEELVNILRRLYVKARSNDGKYSYSVVIQWEQFELARIDS